MEELPARPTDVVRDAAAALEAGRWEDVAALVHPDALRSFRDTHLLMLLQRETWVPRTPEQLLAEQPWLTREVAAFYAEQETRGAARGLPQARAEWGVAESFAELEPLPPAEFFARYLASTSHAARVRGALAMSRKPPKQLETVLEHVAAGGELSRFVVLGDVMEGARRAHVVYRELHGQPYDPENPDPYSVRVTSLESSDGRWWLRPGDGLLLRQAWSIAWAPDEEAGDEGSADGAPHAVG